MQVFRSLNLRDIRQTGRRVLLRVDERERVDGRTREEGILAVQRRRVGRLGGEQRLGLAALKIKCVLPRFVRGASPFVDVVARYECLRTVKEIWKEREEGEGGQETVSETKGTRIRIKWELK